MVSHGPPYVHHVHVTLLLSGSGNTHSQEHPLMGTPTPTHLDAVKIHVSLVAMLLMAFLWAETSPVHIYMFTWNKSKNNKKSNNK